MAVITRSVTNPSMIKTITLLIPGYNSDKPEVSIAPSATVDLFTVITGDELEAIQPLLNQYIASGFLTVSATVDTATFSPVGGGASGVSSLNSLTGSVVLVAGSNVTVTPSENTLTIASTGGNNDSTSVNPMSYGAAGVITTTTGSITSSQNILIVADATGWTTGMGITIANAGTGGNTELITTVTNISGTTFTLQDNALATATTQTVNHDDTAAIAAAIASGHPVKVVAGNYNVTSGLTISNPITFQGEGGDVTIIWNRSSTDNVFTINYTATAEQIETDPVPSTAALISDFQIIQDPNVTPVSGYGFLIQGVSDIDLVTNLHLERVIIKHLYGGVYASNGMVSNWFKDLFMSSMVGGFGIYVNSPGPSGDAHWDNIELTGINTGVGIEATDTIEFTNLKTNGSGISFPTVNNNRVVRVRFINCNIETNEAPPNNGYDFGVNGASQTQIIGGGIGLLTGSAISASHCPGLQVIGVFIYSGGTGIVLSGSDTFATITGNMFANTGTQVVLNDGAQAEISANTGVTNSVGTTLSSINSNSTIYVGISSVDPSAVMEADSTTQGFLPPRMTTTQRTAISSPANGLIVYDTTLNAWYGWNGSAWTTPI